MKRNFMTIVAAVGFAIFCVIPAVGDEDPTEPVYESIEVYVTYEAEDVSFVSPALQYPPNENEVIGTIYSCPDFEQQSDTNKIVIYIVDIDTTGNEAPILNDGPFDQGPTTDDNGGMDPIE